MAKEAVVRIDAEILKDVEKIISLKENKFKYVNKKQFIDLAVLEKLKAERFAK
jgi:hypothetical protein